MPSSRRLRIWVRFLGILVVAAVGWVAAVYWLVSRQADQDESRQAEAIVVFGAAEYSGHPSPIYRARLDHAYTLFRSGMAPLIITTGLAAEDPSFSEGGDGLYYLVSRGVTEGNIMAETESSVTSQ